MVAPAAHRDARGGRGVGSVPRKPGTAQCPRKRTKDLDDEGREEVLLSKVG